jgi:hypothetical protein
LQAEDGLVARIGVAKMTIARIGNVKKDVFIAEAF